MILRGLGDVTSGTVDAVAASCLMYAAQQLNGNPSAAGTSYLGANCGPALLTSGGGVATVSSAGVVTPITPLTTQQEFNLFGFTNGGGILSAAQLAQIQQAQNPTGDNSGGTSTSSSNTGDSATWIPGVPNIAVIGGGVLLLILMVMK